MLLDLLRAHRDVKADHGTEGTTDISERGLAIVV